MDSRPHEPRATLSGEAKIALLASVAAALGAIAEWLARRAQRGELATPATEPAAPSAYRRYDVASLRENLDRFEERFGLGSGEFYGLFLDDAAPDRIPRFSANAWATLWEEYERLVALSAETRAAFDEILAVA